MKVVVTTPTGNVGSRVLQLVCQAGIRPTLLMRDPGKLDPQWRELVDAVAVDQGNAAQVVDATAGADALFWVDPPTPDDDPAAGYARMGASAARAVAENGIRRTVFLSSIGAEKGHGAGEIDGLARTEEMLNDTGADVVHLRCGYFFTNLLFGLDSLRAGVMQTAMPTDLPMPWVDPRDIGDVAAARLMSDWTGQHVLAVHGPSDLSFVGVAEILSEVLGRRIEAQTITDDELRDQLRSAGMSDKQVEGMVGMSSGLREDFVPEQERDALTTTPTSLRSWAYENLRPML